MTTWINIISVLLSGTWHRPYTVRRKEKGWLRVSVSRQQRQTYEQADIRSFQCLPKLTHNSMPLLRGHIFSLPCWLVCFEKLLQKVTLGKHLGGGLGCMWAHLAHWYHLEWSDNKLKLKCSSSVPASALQHFVLLNIGSASRNDLSLHRCVCIYSLWDYANDVHEETSRWRSCVA